MSRALFSSRTGKACAGAVLFSVLVFPSFCAQAQTAGGAQVTRQAWRLEGSTVVIQYELVADPENTFDVAVFLRRKSDPAYQVVPASVSGAVGKGQRAGGIREIRWDYLKDLPVAPGGTDYYFVVEARAYVEEKGWPWWYYAAGGAVIGGVVTAIVVSSGGSTEPEAQLPGPPDTRPNP